MAAQTPIQGRSLSLARGITRRAGLWLRDHQRGVRRLQWIIIVAYAALLLAPLLTPVPTRLSHIWSNATLFAQFAFWGVWWPFVLVSMVLLGRSWCGLLCPEGALAEIASHHGKGRATPRWMRWKGWPFTAFAGTTIYGQMTSVYQYPAPVLVVLGGSTLAAMATGYFYGRDKRVWCRYLCPVNGVFALLAKLAPVHFRVDRATWGLWKRDSDHPPPALNCAPLVPIPTMRGASACHMCGRCAGFRDAVEMAPRRPNAEIVGVAGETPQPWETALITFGLMGLAAGAFEWTLSPLYVTAKQGLAEWLVRHDLMWPLTAHLPWWILTNYPDQNDMLTPLDGGLMIAYVLATAMVTGAATCACLAVAARVLAPLHFGAFDGARSEQPERRIDQNALRTGARSHQLVTANRSEFAPDRQSWSNRFHHLAQGLIPIAGCGVFLGLSAITVTQLRAENLGLYWVNDARAILVAGACVWSLWLIWSIAGRYTVSLLRRLACLAAGALAIACGAVHWIMLFWIW